MSFAHLHVHTEGSLLDGMAKSKDLAKRSAELGMPALACTDHGTMYQAVQFYEACKEHNVKPIIGCCLPGQLIHTLVGMKSIEDIAVGDAVLTHKGRWRPVVSTMSRNYDGLIYGVKAKQCNTVWLTGEHPVLVSDTPTGETKWVRADSLQFGRRGKRGGLRDWKSYAAVPRLSSGSTHTNLNVSLIGHLGTDIYSTSNGSIEKSVKANKYDRIFDTRLSSEIELGEDFAFFIGAFLAEGVIGKQNGKPVSVTLVFGAVSEYKKQAVQRCEKWLDSIGLETTRNYREDRNTVDLVCGSTVFARFMQAFCGSLCDKKVVPTEIMESSLSVQASFLDGLFCDAQVIAGGQTTLKMTNPDAVYAARIIAARLGSLSKVYGSSPSSAGRLPTYSITRSPEVKYRRQGHTEEYLLPPIEDVETRQYSGPVYNFEVEEDNSYVTDFAVHNCELYIAPGSRTSKEGVRYNHLLALAMNKQGYQNLIKLCSKASLEGFYYKPRIDFDLLTEYHEGLIITSSCLGGPLCKPILENEYQQAIYTATQYQRLLGDRFYVELQDHGLEEQAFVRPELVRLAREINSPLVASNDVHYLNQEDADPHEVLLCIQTGKTMKDEKRLRYGPPNFYLRSPDEMANRFKAWPEALANTLTIADRCNFDFEFGKHHLPIFTPPAGYTADAWLEKVCRDNIALRYPAHTQRIEDRLKYELGIIANKGFASYFLIVEDFVAFARGQEIMSQARGSAAGSLVSYLLGLTKIDPLRYNLMFERFLNPDRKSMPDIDLDFADDRRDEVIQYCRDKYGEDHVAQIIAFGTMAAKASVKDAGRALDVPHQTVSRITNLIPTKPPGITIDDAMERVPELKQAFDTDPTTKHIVTTAKRLEGLYRHASTHAAGVVITEHPVDTYAPLQKMKDGRVCIQYDFEDAEKIGLVKMDFLGLRNLRVAQRTLGRLRRDRGIIVDLDALPHDDEPTFRLLQRGDSVGVFQLESHGITRLLRQLRPDRLEDIIALVALYRPGPLQSGMANSFVERKHGREAIEYVLPQLEPILSNSYGLILYQEQIMKITTVLAGFGPGQAEATMKGMGKKKHDVIAKLKDEFLDGCKKNGVNLAIAKQLYDVMANFASYSFNLNHAGAYGMLAYHTAWLKAHYPYEFMTENLASISDKKDKLALQIADVRRLGMRITPPNVNTSGADIGLHTDERGHFIAMGMHAIKDVGAACADAIIEEQQSGGPFTGFADFLQRVAVKRSGVAVGKGHLVSLIRCGALDCLGERNNLLTVLETSLIAVSQARGTAAPLQWDDVSLPVAPMTEAERLANEREYLGVYLTGHPLHAYTGIIVQQATVNTTTIKEKRDGEEVTLGGIVATITKRTTKKGDAMAQVTLEDFYGSTEITFFPRQWEHHSANIRVGNVVLISGRVSHREGATDDDAGTTELQAQNVRRIDQQEESHEAVATLHIYSPVPVVLDTILSADGGSRAVIHADNERYAEARCNITPNAIRALRLALRRTDGYFWFQ